MSDLVRDMGHCQQQKGSPHKGIQAILTPKDKDLGGFSVRRLMPSDTLKAVGPFVFFDHLGPADFKPGAGVDVRPHPHIGLATVTYLFDGEFLHRDNLGNVQPIRPGEVNWMTAGRGIAHSERTPPELRQSGHTLHALQLWVALPEDDEETAPEFIHYAAEQLPVIDEGGRNIRVMVGEALGIKSPVKTYSPTLYLEARLQVGASMSLPENVEESAVYVVHGQVRLHDREILQNHMAVIEPGAGGELLAEEDSLLVVIGGKPLGKRTVWWNLVASRKDLIERAKREWKEGRFPDIPGETEFIPLPE